MNSLTTLPRLKGPATLQEAIVFYSGHVNCHQFMVELRWGSGPVKCPRCGSENIQYLPNAKVFKCYDKHEKQKFSLKVGTFFEDSPIPLEKWLPVMWLLANSKNGVSSWEIHSLAGCHSEDRVVHASARASGDAGG